MSHLGITFVLTDDEAAERDMRNAEPDVPIETTPELEAATDALMDAVRWAFNEDRGAFDNELCGFDFGSPCRDRVREALRILLENKP